jgi:hypothetical protein
MTMKVDRRQFVSGAGGGATLAFLAPSMALAQTGFRLSDIRSALGISSSLAEALSKRLPLERLQRATFVFSAQAPGGQYEFLSNGDSGPAEVKSSLSDVSRLFLLSADKSILASRGAILHFARQYPVGGCIIARFESQGAAWYGAFAHNVVPNEMKVSLLDR